MQKLTAQNGEGEDKKWKTRPLYQTQPEVYDKGKWMSTSERVNLFIYFVNFKKKYLNIGIHVDKPKILVRLKFQLIIPITGAADTPEFSNWRKSASDNGN